MEENEILKIKKDVEGCCAIELGEQEVGWIISTIISIILRGNKSIGVSYYD